MHAWREAKRFVPHLTAMSLSLAMSLVSGAFFETKARVVVFVFAIAIILVAILHAVYFMNVETLLDDDFSDVGHGAGDRDRFNPR